jgi:hypothetical protein
MVEFLMDRDQFGIRSEQQKEWDQFPDRWDRSHDLQTYSNGTNQLNYQPGYVKKDNQQILIRPRKVGPLVQRRTTITDGKDRDGQTGRWLLCWLRAGARKRYGTAPDQSAGDTLAEHGRGELVRAQGGTARMTTRTCGR